MENTLKNKISKIAVSLILGIIGIGMVLPIAWMISSSFKYESDVFKMPMEWIPSRVNLNNYVKAVTDFPYFNWYWNTLKVTFFIVVLALIFSSAAGYAFAKLKFRGRDTIFVMFIATMMIPMQVRVIPQFMLFKWLGMINTHSAIILPWMYIPFAIFLMRQFFMSVPDELLEAAKIDGFSEYRTFWEIALPLAKASLAALTVLSFTWGWNFYFGPLIYISELKKQLLSVGIASFKAEYEQNYAVQMAGSTMALVPIIVVYLIAQNQFIEGIALSGVKG
jgi:multiple sugar transport system permease protein